MLYLLIYILRLVPKEDMEMLDPMALGPGPRVPSGAEEGSRPSEGWGQLWKGQSGQRKHSALVVLTGTI